MAVNYCTPNSNLSMNGINGLQGYRRWRLGDMVQPGWEEGIRRPWAFRSVAVSMLRFRSNCRLILVDPRLLDEVISVTDAMRVNWRSSGVATDEAMVSGLAPGKPACTEIVGKSTCGRGDTGNIRKATAPASPMATVSKVVATGRLIKTSEIFMG